MTRTKRTADTTLCSFCQRTRQPVGFEYHAHGSIAICPGCSRTLRPYAEALHRLEESYSDEFARSLVRLITYAMFRCGNMLDGETIEAALERVTGPRAARLIGCAGDIGGHFGKVIHKKANEG